MRMVSKPIKLRTNLNKPENYKEKNYQPDQCFVLLFRIYTINGIKVSHYRRLVSIRDMCASYLFECACSSYRDVADTNNFNSQIRLRMMSHNPFISEICVLNSIGTLWWRNGLRERSIGGQKEYGNNNIQFANTKLSNDIYHWCLPA